MTTEDQILVGHTKVSDDVFVVELGQALDLPENLLLGFFADGQADPLDGVVDFVQLVLGLKHHSEPTGSEAGHRLVVLHIPGHFNMEK